MTFNMDGRDYWVRNFDAYSERFEKYALPEFACRAEEFLLKTIEGQDYKSVEYFDVFLSEEQTKEKINVKFAFAYCESEEKIMLDYIAEAAEKIHHCVAYDMLEYNDYLKKFRDMALPEYAGDAEKVLFYVLEKIEPHMWKEGFKIKVVLEAEKTKRNNSVCFYFDLYGCEDHVVEYMGYKEC